MVYAHQQGLVHALVAVSAVFVTLALVAAVYFLNVRVTVTDTEVIVREMTGRSRRFPRLGVEGCALISVLFPFDVTPTHLAVVHAPSGQALFTLAANLWDKRSLRALTGALEPSHHGRTRFEDLSKEELRARYPAAYRHVWGPGAWLRGLLLVLLIIAVGLTVQFLLQ